MISAVHISKSRSLIWKGQRNVQSTSRHTVSRSLWKLSNIGVRVWQKTNSRLWRSLRRKRKCGWFLGWYRISWVRVMGWGEFEGLYIACLHLKKSMGYDPPGKLGGSYMNSSQNLSCVGFVDFRRHRSTLLIHSHKISMTNHGHGIHSKS